MGRVPRVTLYNQAKARIESGAAKSVSEASRQLAEETGRNPETIRQRIKEAQLDEGVQLSHLAGTDKHAPNPIPIIALGEKEIAADSLARLTVAGETPCSVAMSSAVDKDGSF